MVARRSNTANAYEGTLTTAMAPTDLTAVVDTTSGGPASPGYLVIDPGDASKREYVYFDGTFTATTFVTTLIGNRYLTGSAAGSGITHAVGAKVRSATTSELYTDLFDYIETVTKIGSTAIGDMLVVSAVTAGVATFARVPKGTAYQKLRMNAGATAPEWTGLVGCSAKKSTTETCASGATLAGIVFGAEDYDTSSFHSTSANTDSFVAPYTGYHRVNYGIAFTNGATVSSGPVQTYLKYNNQSTNVAIDLAADKLETTELKASVAQILAGSGTKFLNAGDVLSLVFDNASGSTATLSTGTACYFQITFEGP